MYIYIFKSDTNRELQAFSGQRSGTGLPDRFGPWHAIGVIRPEAAPPHGLSRSVIEKSIAEEGFQLWRRKAAPAQTAAALRA
jgi:hypothetical protein